MSNYVNTDNIHYVCIYTHIQMTLFTWYCLVLGGQEDSQMAIKWHPTVKSWKTKNDKTLRHFIFFIQISCLIINHSCFHLLFRSCLHSVVLIDVQKTFKGTYFPFTILVIIFWVIFMKSSISLHLEVLSPFSSCSL